MYLLGLILNLALAAAPQVPGQPMKSPMGYILNDVINGSLSQVKLEETGIAMKNYQLFVYVGDRCRDCQAYIENLHQLARAQNKNLNVILVYDFASKPNDSFKSFVKASPSFECLDEKGYLYYKLFESPRYLSFVLTGPQHTVLKSAQFKNPTDILSLAQEIKK